MVTVTESAQTYLKELLGKQGDDVLGIRIFINSPGTSHAETCIAYCREEDHEESDDEVAYDGFSAFYDARSLPYLEDAIVDFSEDKFGGQLTIKAPNAKLPKVDENSSIEDRVNYALHNEVNPSLAEHGGQVSLMEVTEDMTAVLKFGGGCQGCGMVDVTLKNGIETTLLAQIPELTGVRDVTDHSDTTQAYI
ncbi:MAG: Fe-S biogenesis protein NfuA [Pseudomonadota bacterium]